MANRLGIVVTKQKDFAALKARFRNTFPILKLDGPGGHAVTTGDIIAVARKQIKMLLATPTKTLRRPEAAPNGRAIRTTTRQVQGSAIRPCH